MSRELWFNPAVGVAGDMVLASLLDVGADEQWVHGQLDELDLPGWALTVEATSRRGIVATGVSVEATTHDHHRPWSWIDKMLADSALHPEVADGARRTFEALGRAEAQVHGIEIDQVHFHEVGAVDAIVDIVGSWAALVSLEVGAVHSAPIGLGTGTASMAHGIVPVPAPATLQLLIGAPTVPVEFDGETATPTGAALLTTMVSHWGHLPAGTLERIGRGSGTRDPESHANVLTAVIVQTASDVATVTATMLETNLDDVTPEIIGHVIDRALALGADDAWVGPITMKKSRPAQQLHVLCRPDLAAQMSELIATETGTLGLRQWSVDKHEFARRVDHVVLDGHTVHIKVGPHGAKPEHDELVAASVALGRPVRVLAQEALSLWQDART